jgi:hypothetical protein
MICVGFVVVVVQLPTKPDAHVVLLKVAMAFLVQRFITTFAGNVVETLRRALERIKSQWKKSANSIV